VHDATKLKTELLSTSQNVPTPGELSPQIIQQISTQQGIHPEAVQILGLGNIWQHYLRIIVDVIQDHVHRPSFGNWTSLETNNVLTHLSVQTGFPVEEVKTLIAKCMEFFETFEAAKEFVGNETPTQYLVRNPTLLGTNQNTNSVPIPKMYSCEYCPEQFPKQNSFASHMKKHQKEKFEKFERQKAEKIKKENKALDDSSDEGMKKSDKPLKRSSGLPDVEQNTKRPRKT